MSPTPFVPVRDRRAPRSWERIRLMGMRLDVVDEGKLLDELFDALTRGMGGWVITANLDHLRRFVVRPRAREPYEVAEFVVADGMPLVWASRRQGTPLPERVAGSSLIYPLSERAAADGRSLYLLGGSPGTGERAAELLRERSPGLRVAGIDCPAWGFEKDPDRFEDVRAKVVAAAPDIVLVCLGSPKQELVISRLYADVPEAWFLGLGVSLSFVAGSIARAPPWMQQAGLEWVHRLGSEPRRLFGRYVRHGLPFALRLAGHVHRRRRTQERPPYAVDRRAR